MKIKVLMALAAFSVVGSTQAQRFYLSLPGSNGADAPSVIQAGPDGRFQVEVWFENTGVSTLAAIRTSGMMFTFDKSTTSGSSAVRTQNILNLDGAINQGSNGGAFLEGSSIFPLWLTPSMRGGLSPGVGNNLPIGYSGDERPWGCFLPQSGLQPSDILPGTKFQLVRMKLRMTGSPGDIYGDDPSEVGLLLYKHKARTTETGIPIGGSGFSNSPVFTVFFGSTKYAVQLVPEPIALLALGLGSIVLICRKRN